MTRRKVFIVFAISVIALRLAALGLGFSDMETTINSVVWGLFGGALAPSWHWLFRNPPAPNAEKRPHYPMKGSAGAAVR